MRTKSQSILQRPAAVYKRPDLASSRLRRDFWRISRSGPRRCPRCSSWWSKYWSVLSEGKCSLSQHGCHDLPCRHSASKIREWNTKMMNSIWCCVAIGSTTVCNNPSFIMRTLYEQETSQPLGKCVKFRGDSDTGRSKKQTSLSWTESALSAKKAVSF